MRIQIYNKIYENHSSLAMNGILEVLPEVPFKTKESNYGKHAYRLSKKGTVGNLEPQSSALTRNELNFEDIVGTDTHS